MTRETCLATLIVCALAGCSLFNRSNNSVPQQFLEALVHGNGVRASQLWLQMTPAERQTLAHNQNLSPRNSAAAVPVKLQPDGSPGKGQTGGVVDDTDSSFSLEPNDLDSDNIALPQSSVGNFSLH